MMSLMTKLRAMKDRALELIDDIEANVSVCCAITMEPDMVLQLIEELKDIIEQEWE